MPLLDTFDTAAAPNNGRTDFEAVNVSGGTTAAGSAVNGFTWDASAWFVRQPSTSDSRAATLNWPGSAGFRAVLNSWAPGNRDQTATVNARQGTAASGTGQVRTGFTLRSAGTNSDPTGVFFGYDHAAGAYVIGSYVSGVWTQWGAWTSAWSAGSDDTLVAQVSGATGAIAATLSVDGTQRISVTGQTGPDGTGGLRLVTQFLADEGANERGLQFLDITADVVSSGSITVDAPETNTITQGSTLNVPITITRTAPFAGDVTITATGLPTGVTAGALTILAASTTGTLVLTASGAAPPVTDDAWQVVASGSGVSNATDDVTLTVTAAPNTQPSPQAWTAAITQRFAGATERVPLPLLANATTGQLLTSATGITLDFRSVSDRAAGNAYAAAPVGISLAYNGRAGSFDLLLRDTDDAALGVLSVYIAGTAAPVEVHVQVLSPDARTVPTPQQNADGLIARNVNGGTDGGRTVSWALQSTGINRFGITGTGANRVFTQYGTDDVTPLYTTSLANVATPAFTESDPT